MKIYFNGPILTMEDNQKYAESLIEDNGRILFVGSLKKAKQLINEQTEWIDLNQKTLMPAFIDAHSHLSDMAQTLKTADLRSARSFSDIHALLTAFIDEHPECHQMIIGLNYDHTILQEKTHPNKLLLDQVSKDIPIAIIHANLHMCSINSKLLNMLHISAESPDIEGGIIGRLPSSDEPSGYLEEAASFPVRNLLKEYYPISEKDLIAAQEYYIENGYLTIQDGAVDESLVHVYASASKNKDLIADIVAFPCFNFGSDVGETISKYPEYLNKYMEHFKIGGYKLLLDGSPQGKSAWLSEPYEGENTYCGYPWLSDDEVEIYIRKSFTNQLQILTHCNGDAACEQLLRVYQKVYDSIPSNKLSPFTSRPVMIHCQTVRKDQLSKMQTLNMIASLFVEHVYYWGDVHLKNLGESRARQISPAKSALDHHLIYTFHSDAPVVLPKPLHSIWTACNRLTKEGILLGPEECIDVYNALKGITIHAAYSYFEENEKGSLKEGKKADFVIIDKNPLLIDPMEIKDIQVLTCIKDGHIVFNK